MTNSEIEPIAGYKVHPVAAMFPLIEGAAYEELQASVRAHRRDAPGHHRERRPA